MKISDGGGPFKKSETHGAENGCGDKQALYRGYFPRCVSCNNISLLQGSHHHVCAEENPFLNKLK